MEDINLLNGEYGSIQVDKRVSRNQLKTRQSSFKSILGHWNDFRSKNIEDVQKALEEKKTELVNEEFKINNNGDLSYFSNLKMDRKVLDIAILEYEVRILSKESVPRDFIKSRAIKLKKNMIESLEYKSKRIYAIAEEDMNKVFAEEKPAEEVAPIDIAPTEEVVPVNENVMVPPVAGEIVEETVPVDQVEVPMADASEEVVPTEEVAPVEEVKPEEQVVEETVPVDQVEVPMTDASEEVVPAEEVAPVDEVETHEEAVDEREEDTSLDNEYHMDDITEDVAITDIAEENVFDKEINVDEIKDAVDKAIDESTKYMNPSSMANIEKYDEEGEEKESYQDIPMTDEEIEQENIRDEVQVVPENSHSESQYDFASLKESLLALNDSIKNLNVNKATAEQDAEMASNRAMKVKADFEESEKRKNEKLEKLNQYKQALERKKAEIERQTKEAQEEADRNRDFINLQEAKIHENDSLSDEIDSLLSEEENANLVEEEVSKGR